MTAQQTERPTVVVSQAAEVLPRVHEEREVSARRWRRHARWLFVTDFAAVAVASFIGLGVLLADSAWDAPNYGSSLVTVALVAGWILALQVSRTRDRRVVGVGLKEYARIARATWHTFAVLAIVSFAFDFSVARGHVVVAFPLGLALLLVSRRRWRQKLHGLRLGGEAMSPTLVAGHREHVRRLVRTLQKSPEIGYKVIGACVPRGEMPPGGSIDGVPVVGHLETAASLATELGVEVLAVTGSDETTAEFVRGLGWALSPHGIDLVLASSLTDVAGPRIVVTPVEGARLVHVDAPSFSGAKYVVKSCLDTVTAALAGVVLGPLLVAIAVAIKADSSGPVLFKQVRIGRNGVPFTMYKFRSMVTGSERRLEEVLGGTVGMFYKSRTDWRVTRVGRILRRTSLDELPQLFNVIKQEMSLVGPRPQVEREVAQYDGVISRRLLVKPGLTGLWQVNGRSDLPLDESIRYDLNYVENWSPIGDLVILFKTFRAMRQGAGAY